MIEIDKLKYYVQDGGSKRQILAVDELIIRENEFVLIDGKTGAGKSTLLFLLAGLIKHSQGTLKVAGREINRLSDYFLHHYRRHNVGIVFQHFNVIEELTVLDNIELPLIPENISQQEDIIQTLLVQFSLIERSRNKIKTLSGGEKQRVALARALVFNPSLLLFDEPSAHLDQEATVELAGFINQLHEQGKTIVVVSHDPLLREHMKCKRAIVITNGVIE